jgi:hypothetical protein
MFVSKITLFLKDMLLCGTHQIANASFEIYLGRKYIAITITQFSQNVHLNPEFHEIRIVRIGLWL